MVEIQIYFVWKVYLALDARLSNKKSRSELGLHLEATESSAGIPGEEERERDKDSQSSGNTRDRAIQWHKIYPNIKGSSDVLRTPGLTLLEDFDSKPYLPCKHQTI